MSQRNIPREALDFLAAGDIEAANKLLGSCYSLCGTVVHGNHLGRTLGFPTANLLLEADSPVLLKNGVYLVHSILAEGGHHGLANIGIRPTLNGTTLTVEVHLIGFSGDLYGRFLKVDFLKRIREERKFGNLQQLAEQIDRDKKEALLMLA